MFSFVFFWGKWFLEAMLFWYLVHVYCVVVKILLSIKVFIVCFKKKKKKPDKYYNKLAFPQVFFFFFIFFFSTFLTFQYLFLQRVH